MLPEDRFKQPQNAFRFGWGVACSKSFLTKRYLHVHIAPFPPHAYFVQRTKCDVCFRRWTDDMIEGFLQSTLVEGSGLVLTKLDPGRRGKKIGASSVNVPCIYGDTVWWCDGKICLRAHGVKTRSRKTCRFDMENKTIKCKIIYSLLNCQSSDHLVDTRRPNFSLNTVPSLTRRKQRTPL